MPGLGNSPEAGVSGRAARHRRRRTHRVHAEHGNNQFLADVQIHLQDLKVTTRLDQRGGHLGEVGREAKRLQPSSEPDGPPSGAIPLPLSAISIGQDDRDQTFMMVEVGSTALMFGVAPNCLKELGQTLLTPSAAPGRKPS